jgi:hypothetical protein
MLEIIMLGNWGYNLKGLFNTSICIGLTYFTFLDVAISEVLPQPFVHPSAAAMGGAYTAVANDDSSPFTNPAGIARIRKARSRGKFQLLRAPQFFVGSNSISNYTELASLQGRHMLGSQGWDKDISGPYLQIGKLSDGMPDLAELDDALIEIFQDDTSANVWGRFDLGFLSVFEIDKGLPISLGLYLTSQGTLKINDASVTSGSDVSSTTFVRYTDIINIMPVIGTSFSTKSKRMSLGLQIRPILRHSYDGTNQLADYGNTETITTEITDNANEDSAIAYDMGFMWTLADFWYPTIGIAVFNIPTGCKSDYLNPYDQTPSNICGTNFESATTVDKNSLANLDPTDIRVGMSISPRLARKMALRLSFDYHYLSYETEDANYGLPNIPSIHKTHVGMEFYLGNPLELPPFRAKIGLNQGQLTIGGNLDLKYMQIDLASYGLDQSVDDSPIPDRRTVLAISAGF